MTNKINFTEVNPISNKDTSSIKKQVLKSINKKNFILGDEVKKFETNFAKMAKTKFAIGCGNGTDALTLSLMALNLKERDEVIVPALTYISTGLAVILNKNKLVLADIDDRTGLISLDSLKSKITKRTKVVIPVNLYGQKVDLIKIRKIVGKKIHIIEDSAQSHFAFNKNDKKVSFNHISTASCYSFYPAKNLGAYGDAGLITTNNKKFNNKLLALRNLGSIKKHKHFLIGMNSRLDTVQAVVLKNKLKSIFKMNEKRRKVANLYDKLLSSITNIKLTKTNAGSTRHLYIVRTKKRDKLIKYLSKKKIYCQIHYPYSLNKLPAFKGLVKKTKLKNSEKWARECLSLPIHPNLKLSEIDKIVKELKLFYKKN